MSGKLKSASQAFSAHDHARCVGQAIPFAEAQCAERGVRLTPVRRRVLEILLESHRALGAYDILARLREEGHAAQPPVAYRALDFLVEQGFVHKIEGISAFVACTRPDDHLDATLLICQSCQTVAELPLGAVEDQIHALAGTHGFTVTRQRVEIEGTCPACQQAP